MRKNDYDSRLIIHKSRRFSLFILLVLMTVTFAILIQEGNEEGLHWYQMSLPIIGLGLLALLFPLTEEWEYRAWQGKPRKVEQNFDR